MAGKKKQKEVRYVDMSLEDLNQRLRKGQEDLFKARFRAASAPATNTMEIRTLRREIARLNTFINQNQKSASQSAAANQSNRRTGRGS